MGGNWIYIIVAVFIGLGKLLEYMREQRDIKVARENAAKQREEAIRTGRDPNSQAQTTQKEQPSRPQPATAAQSRDQRMRELAAKRQAELRDLRERQAQNRAQRGTQDAPTQARSPRMPETSSSPRSARVLKPGTPKQRTQQTKPAARERSTSSGADSARESQLRRERERQREIAQQREIELDAQRRDQDTKRRAAQTKKRERDQQVLKRTEAARLASAGITGSDMSKSIRELLTGGTAGTRRDRLRQVIAINEILDKPISQREPRDSF